MNEWMMLLQGSENLFSIKIPNTNYLVLVQLIILLLLAITITLLVIFLATIHQPTPSQQRDLNITSISYQDETGIS